MNIQRSDIQKIVVVASDVHEIARHFGGYTKLTTVPETIHHGGVNNALTDGFSFLKQEFPSKTLIFPSDLPMLNYQRVNEALRLLDRYELIINPSYKKNGTNLLGIRTADRFVFHYDDDSYRRHLDEAESLHLDYHTVDWDEFSFDIDDADDLEMLINTYGTANFEELLLKISQG